MLKVLKSQDKSYLQTIKNSEDKKIESLRSTLHLSSVEKNNQHLKFATEDTAIGKDTDTNEIGIISDAESVHDDAVLSKTKPSSFSSSRTQGIVNNRKRRRTTMNDDDNNDDDDDQGEESIPITVTANSRSHGGNTNATDAPTDLSPEEIKRLRKQRKILTKENKKTYIDRKSVV